MSLETTIDAGSLEACLRDTTYAAEALAEGESAAGGAGGVAAWRNVSDGGTWSPGPHDEAGVHAGGEVHRLPRDERQWDHHGAMTLLDVLAARSDGAGPAVAPQVIASSASMVPGA